MSLSPTGETYLHRQQRVPSITDPTEIEDGEPIASSFDVFVEGAAVFDELWSRGWRPINIVSIAEPDSTPSTGLSEQMIQRFGLSAVSAATVEHSGWWVSDSIAFWKRGRRTTALVKSTDG
jgi:hypothetical protein